jgi:Zn-dependent alcohol dehydrogenase
MQQLLAQRFGNSGSLRRPASGDVRGIANQEDSIGIQFALPQDDSIPRCKSSTVQRDSILVELNHARIGPLMQRRQFIQAAAAGTALSRAPFIRAANKGKRYRTALIGRGWWGMNILREAMKAGNTKVVALCDVDQDKLEIAAIKAGAHIFVEKPTGHTIGESQAMLAAARSNSRVVQVGLHRRIGPHDRSGMKFLKDGGAGRIGGTSSDQYEFARDAVAKARPQHSMGR